MSKLACLLVAVFSVTLGFCASTENTESTASVAALFPMTGMYSSMGGDAKQGAKLAMQNLKGQLPVLQLNYIDTQSTVNGAIKAFDEVLQQAYLGVIGDFYTAAMLALAPLAEKAQIPLITPSATNDQITQGKTFVFRTTYTDQAQAEAMAFFAYKTLNAKTAAILQDKTSAYSMGLSQTFQSAYEKLGGKVVAIHSYTQNTYSYLTQLNQINKRRPEVLYVPGFAQQAGTIILEGRSLDMRCKFLGSDGWDNLSLLNMLSAGMLENCYFTSPFNAFSTSPIVQRFVQDYRQAYGEMPNSFAALTYDTVMLMHLAVQKAGAMNPIAIDKGIQSIRDYQGVTGSISFNVGPDPHRPVYILKIEGMNTKLIETILPE